MSIALPELPYPVDALEPYISAQTLSIHHRKHHRLVDKANALISNAGSAGGRSHPRPPLATLATTEKEQCT